LNIVALGKSGLSELGISFISVPVPAIPVLKKTYRFKYLFYVSKEILLEKLKSVNPIIVFDVDIYNTPPELDKRIIPDYITLNGGGYYIRGIVVGDDMPLSEWKILKENIIESNDHNFTFNWYIDCCKDRDFIKTISRRNSEKSIMDRVDEMERVNNLTQAQAPGKKYYKKW
jgi:hypothetical protein